MKDRETFRVLNGRDPCNTVFFSGFHQRYIRPLYVQSIKKLFSSCTNTPDNIQVSFDEGTEKVFVSFKQTQESLDANTDADLNIVEMGPGQVCVEVYRALKLRKSSKALVVQVMHPFDAQRYGEKLKIGSLVEGKWECRMNTIKNIEMICLPRKMVKSVTGKITHYDTHFNCFWLRSDEEETLFHEIQLEVNSSKDIEEFSHFDDIEVGQVVAAQFDGVFNRAKVLFAIAEAETMYYNVMLLDIGREVLVNFSELRRFRGVSAKYIDMPPRVFECRLAFIQPSELHSDRYEWQSIMAEFQQLTSDGKVCAEIYSVDKGVASVSITVHNRTVQDILIEEGFARAADENFNSKFDHHQRVQSQEQKNRRFEEEYELMDEEMRKMMPIEEACEVDELGMGTRHITVPLIGPKSPLESDLYTCLYQAKCQSKQVVVDTHSVNSVLLEANPLDSFENYVVAAYVTENQRKSDLTARETTIMPSIPGFGPLMALLFSPYCELFRDRYKSRYVAILCGLGVHPRTEQPIYGEHDAVFNLDCEIDVIDIEIVNRIRIVLDTFLQMKSDQKQPMVAEYNRNELTLRIKSDIFALLERQRPLMGISHNSNIGWSKHDPNDVIKAKNVFSSTSIFRSHNILTLAVADSPERLDYLHDLIQNNKELHRTSKSDVALRRAIKCLLCNMDFENVSSLKIHLLSRLHREREKGISLETYN